MQIDGWFLIPAILLALFSNKIDKAAKADTKLRPVLWVFCGGVALVCIIALAASAMAR